MRRRRCSFGGKAYQYKVLPFGLALAPRTFTKCMDATLAPLRLQGIRVLNYLDAHSGSLQGASESSQKYCSTPHPFSWPQDERQEECTPPISANPVSGSSFGFHSDAGPFGSCPDIQFYSMSGPLQARPACLYRFMPQAARPDMRPFFWWIKELRLHPTVPATRLIRVSRSCSRPLLQWRNPAFLRSGVRIGAIHRRHMVTTDASMTGWGAVFEGRPANGEWTGDFLYWHINCLELRAVFLALMYFLLVLGGHRIIVRTDNMAVVSHINRQGVSQSRTLDRLPVLEGSSRSGDTKPRGRLSVKTETQAGRMDVKPSDSIPDLGSVWQSGSGPLCFSRVIPVPALVLRAGIASARAPATRKLYSSKWGVFESWCLTLAIDPVNCPVGPVLEFLQERMIAGAAATTLRVYVAAIAARRALDEIPLGRHRLVSAFMRGVRRLRPAHPTAVPSWDLSVVLEGLVTAPFEPLESAS